MKIYVKTMLDPVHVSYNIIKQYWKILLFCLSKIQLTYLFVYMHMFNVSIVVQYRQNKFKAKTVIENHILKYTKQSVYESCSSKNNDKIAR